MFNFLTFVVDEDGEFYFANKLDSYPDILYHYSILGKKNHFICEWSENDEGQTLNIFLSDYNESLATKKDIKANILNFYKNREELISNIVYVKTDYAEFFYDEMGEFHNYQPDLFNGAAVIWKSGTKEWFEHGLRWRKDNLPIVESDDGRCLWLKDSIFFDESERPVVWLDEEKDFWEEESFDEDYKEYFDESWEDY